MKLFTAVTPLGQLSFTPFISEDQMSKVLFELGRVTDRRTHYNDMFPIAMDARPNPDTGEPAPLERIRARREERGLTCRGQIVAGMVGHIPMPTRFLDSSDLPSDRSRRNDWVDTGTEIIVP